MANFIGFSFGGTQLTKMWAGTAYDICQKVTNLFDHDPNEFDVLSGLDSKAVLRTNFHVHSSSMNNSALHDAKASSTLSTCLHPLAKCQAEACYVIGKMYHCQFDYTHAIKWYYKSVALAPYFTLALFGLAQMYIHCAKVEHAKTCLERILAIDEEKHQENDSQVLTHYAYVCRKVGDMEKAKDNLEKACKINPNLVDLWIDLAEITEKSNPSYSIQKYMKAKAILEANRKPVPFELFNNIIVLLYELKDFEKAKQLSEELIAIMKEEDKEKTEPEMDDNHNHNHNNNNSGNEKIEPRQIVPHYNYARILDELGEHKKARKIYRQILVSCPSFIEAILCNALYLYRTGKHNDAIKKFEESDNKAIKLKLINIELDSKLYLQRIYTQIGKRHDAEMVLRKIDEFRKSKTAAASESKYDIQNDEYSELVSANYMLSLNRTRHHHHSNYYQRVHNALRRFQQVLVTNPNNVYAVHGLGVVAAEAAELSVAKNILSKLRDCFSCSTLPCNADMLVNLGHVYCAYQQWDNALKCYEKARKKLLPHQEGDIPLYIVRALFAKKDFVAAKLKLHQILRYNPTQELYLYNLALIEEEYACDILRKDPKKRTLAEVNNVIVMLNNAKNLYKRLDANKKTYAGIPNDRLKQHLDHIRNELLENAKKHLEFQENEESRREKKRLQEQKKFERHKEKELRKQQEQEAKERRQRQLLQQRALDAKMKGNQIQIDFFPEHNGGRSGGRKRKRNSRGVAANDDGNNGIGEAPELEPPTKRYKAQPSMDQFNRDEYADDENHNHNQNRFEEEEVEMLDQEQAEKKRLKKKKKKKKKKDKEKEGGEKGEIDPEIWQQLETKIEEIVSNSDLNSLTNRQVKDQLSDAFPAVDIKLYKANIKQKITEVAKRLQAMNGN